MTTLKFITKNFWREIILMLIAITTIIITLSSCSNKSCPTYSEKDRTHGYFYTPHSVKR